MQFLSYLKDQFRYLFIKKKTFFEKIINFGVKLSKISMLKKLLKKIFFNQNYLDKVNIWKKY